MSWNLGHPERLPRAVVFDWDNTLADTFGVVQIALNAALVAMGQQPWSELETRQRVRRSMRESFPELFGERWPEAREIFFKAFLERHLEGLRPMPGAGELLQAFSAAGVALAVVSNKTGPYLRQEAEALGWSPYFIQVIGAGDAPIDKPDPAPVALALAPLGIVPGSPACGEVWFIGDTDIDLQCAHATGCVPVLIGPGDEGCRERFRPVFHFDDCIALSALVRHLDDPISASALGAASGRTG